MCPTNGHQLMRENLAACAQFSKCVTLNSMSHFYGKCLIEWNILPNFLGGNCTATMPL